MVLVDTGGTRRSEDWPLSKSASRPRERRYIFDDLQLPLQYSLPPRHFKNRQLVWTSTNLGNKCVSICVGSLENTKLRIHL